MKINGLDACDLCMKVMPYSIVRMNGCKGAFICEDCILHANARLPSWRALKEEISKLCGKKS